jgi:iron complex transport system ATP-binding protein
MKDGKILACGTPYEIFTEDLIQELYGVEVEMQSLYGDKARICIPKSIIEKDYSQRFCS